MIVILNFIKRESVLFISLLLAVISCFLIPPDAEYISYIDIRTLSLLFSLMAVMAGMQGLFVFKRIGRALLRKTKNVTELSAVLVFLCFFTSMFITNDVALITFVPFAVDLFQTCGKRKQLLTVVVLQTIAANLGSMLTPPGNPQNLYLYSVSGMPITEFTAVMLPFSAMSFVLLCVSLRFIKNDPVDLPEDRAVYPALNKKRLITYLILFAVCLLSVLHVIPHYVPLIAAVVLIAVFDRRVFGRIDYGLLLTFAALFVLVGNLARIPAVYGFVSAVTAEHPFAVSVGVSQVISNVPAALLLSGFTGEYSEILKGVNVGGLGTLIASMASLISYKLYSQSEGSRSGKYMLVFTLFNTVFLAALCLLNVFL